MRPVNLTQYENINKFRACLGNYYLKPSYTCVFRLSGNIYIFIFTGTVKALPSTAEYTKLVSIGMSQVLSEIRIINIYSFESFTTQIILYLY